MIYLHRLCPGVLSAFLTTEKQPTILENQPAVIGNSDARFGPITGKIDPSGTI